MKRAVLASVALLTGMATATVYAEEAAKAAKADNKPVAKVNGVAIPQARLDLVLKQAQAQAQAQGQPQGPDLEKNAREALISREILSQQAKKKGLDKRADVAAAIELARQEILGRVFIDDYLKGNPISDDEMKKEYEKLKQQETAAQGDKEYKASHILVATEADAKDVQEKLKKGEKFETLAEQKSTDPGSKERGGDLGWNMPGTYVKPFAEALTKLKKGETTTAPVQTQFGYHIIRLDDIRNFSPPPFDQVKPRLQQHMQQQQVQKLMGDLRAKAKIE